MAAAPARVISMPFTAVDAAEPRPAEKLLASFLLYGTVGLLMFGPLAFGAVEPWSIFILEAGAAVLFLAWAAKQVLSGWGSLAWNSLFPPMLLFALVIAAQFLFGTAAYPYATTTQARQYLAYGALCFVAVQTLAQPFAQEKFVRLFSVYGFALALFAILQSLTSNGKLYWLRTPRFGGWIYGPYVNHNHYAGLMEMLAPLPLLLCLTSKVRGGQKFLLCFAALLMAATIFLSGSRGGMMAFSLQAILLAAIAWKRSKSYSGMVTAVAFVVLLGALISWLGWSAVAARWQEVHLTHGVELSANTRLAIDRDTLRMIAARPLLGWGLGNFPTLYPQFRSFYTDMYANAAHNDYLQFLVETGALGGLAMLWFILILCRRGARHLQKWNSQTDGALPLAAFIGCCGILVHSFVDFNLQIPANAALFYVLATLASASPFNKRP